MKRCLYLGFFFFAWRAMALAMMGEALLHCGDGDVREAILVVEDSQGVEAPLGLDLQVPLQKLALGCAPVLQFIGVHLHPVCLDALDELFDCVARRGGEAQFHGDVAQLRDEEVQHLQAQQDHHRGDQGGHVHACAASQADSRRYPQARRRGQSSDHVLLEDDGARSQEADARHHLCGNARGILQVHAKSIL